jgi:hypothetical protein
MKKGGEPGEVAINPALVTHVRSETGPYTDIFFGAHRVAVMGSFQEVMCRLAGELEPVKKPKVERNWIASSS